VLGFGTFTPASSLHSIDLRLGSARAELVVWTDDTDQAYEHAVAHGARSLTPPHDFLGRLRAAWVGDLDGNPIQIVAEPDS
jgi:hypothetical protein